MIFGFRKNINIMHIYAMLLVNLILKVILTTITIFVLGKFDNMDRMFAGFVILQFLLYHTRKFCQIIQQKFF